MAKFQYLLRRASTYLNLWSNRSKDELLTDGEIVYSKNNVCLHSTDKRTNHLNHTLGYLTVKCHYNNTIHTNDHEDDHKWTLCLQWTPNESLTKNTKPLEQNFDNHYNYEYFRRNKVQNNSQTNNDFRNCFDNEINSFITMKIDSFGEEVCDDSLLTINNNNQQITNSSHESDNDLKRCVSTSECDISLTATEDKTRPVRRCRSCRTTPIKTNLSNECSIDTFCVDLKQIKSLRLFFGDESVDTSSNDSTNGQNVENGQLVIVSRDSFYKVFHFHTGGLDKLSTVLNDWDFFDKCETTNETKYLQFSICRPQLKTEECHPEEKLYVSINESQWENSVNQFGQIINESNLRKTIFFAGIEPSLRKEIWPFLLHRYEFNSTYAQREADNSIKSQQYFEISKKLDLMNQNEKELFWRNVQSIVEKDVVRTDRSNPFFAGDNNDNIDKMKRILTNFALYCPSMGYTQGMSDLLAPLLIEIKSEVQTFWCFVGMMRFTHFVCSPKDTDMDHNLVII